MGGGMMKKIFLFILLLVSFSCHAGTEVKPEDKPTRRSFVNASKHIFVYMNDTLNCLLTAKGILKVLLISYPLIVIYGKIFHCSPADVLVRRCVSFWGYLKEIYMVQEEYGRAQVIAEQLRRFPKQSFYSTMMDYIDRVFKNGIPTMAVEFTKYLFIPKK